jgi:hypothetical protein
MERGKVRDMKRRGKGDGGNKRSAEIKVREGGKRQQKYEHYLRVVTMHTLYFSRQYSTYWPPDCQTTQLSA